MDAIIEKAGIRKGEIVVVPIGGLAGEVEIAGDEPRGVVVGFVGS
jgi:hypothetical protein